MSWKVGKEMMKTIKKCLEYQDWPNGIIKIMPYWNLYKNVLQGTTFDHFCRFVTSCETNHKAHLLAKRLEKIRKKL
jgi:hypothetical protein